ncbi:MAG: hypothetical protein ACKV2O_09480 [Acidimicrobiales bacterium]
MMFLAGASVGVGAGCAAQGGSVEQFCAQVQRVPTITQADDLTVPDTATATEALEVELRRLREAAPSAIRGDVSVMVDVMGDIALALSSGSTADVEAARSRVARANDTWKAASDNVVSYATTHCGIDLTDR